VVTEMRRVHEEGLVDSLAWVLMPDHRHWLVQLGEGSALAAVMKPFKARSARAVNRALGRSGPVWHSISGSGTDATTTSQSLVDAASTQVSDGPNEFGPTTRNQPIGAIRWRFRRMSVGGPPLRASCQSPVASQSQKYGEEFSQKR
jgi:hypothetical protein